MRFQAFISAMVCLCMLNLGTSFGEALRVYHIGNSLTDNIYYDGLKQIAQENKNTYTYGKDVSPGAPLDYLWEGVGKDGNSTYSIAPYGRYQTALKNYTWDVMTLEPFDNEITGSTGDLKISEDFVNYALKKSPNVQTYVYERWVSRPQDSKGNFLPFNYDQLYMTPYTGSINRWDKADERQGYFVTLDKDINNAMPKEKKNVDLVPVGDVFDLLDKDIKAGKIKGYSNITQFYADALHMNAEGAYVIALTFYATMYKHDPIGQSIPGAYGKWNSTTAKEVQTAVWDVVSTEKYDGVGGINGKAFATPAIAASAPDFASVVPEPAAIGLLAAIPVLLRRRRACA